MKCSSNIAVTNADTAIPPWKLSGNKFETLNSQPLHCKHLAILDFRKQQLLRSNSSRRSTCRKTALAITDAFIPTVQFYCFNKAPFIWRKPVPGRRVNLPAEFIFSRRLYEKTGWPRAGHSVFFWRKVGPATRMSLPSQKDNPARQVILLAPRWWGERSRKIARKPRGEDRVVEPVSIMFNTSFRYTREILSSGIPAPGIPFD